MQVREGVCFPLEAEDGHGMQLAGFASSPHATTSTPRYLHSLGIHEPVYGELRRVPSLVNKIQVATSVASSLASKGPLSTLSAADLAPLNAGKVDLTRIPRRTTKRAVEAQKKRDAWEIKDKTKIEAVRRRSDDEAKRKMPRVTTIGSVGLVKAKEGDVAGKVVGEVTQNVLYRPYRVRLVNVIIDYFD
ncbi:hypothetical protein BC829DRAFT_437844 [Chytridium lagenaria]|nr:hypothetical protein BC829DRAFT_437844 [Chytridium lagenaria]